MFVLLLTGDENWDFFASWSMAIICVCLLHFAGACAQWYIGRVRCVQIWGNTTLPVEMLAASDAVLREANWFKVGLVGLFPFASNPNLHPMNPTPLQLSFWPRAVRMER